MIARPLIALLGACKDDPVGQGSYLAQDFLVPAGTHLTFAPLDEPDGPTWTLGLASRDWERRDGDDWDDGTALETFAVETSDGLVVDGVRMLPASFDRGTTDGGAEVVEIGAHEAWYGTFDLAVTVEITAGRFAGANTFAKGFGPVGLTLDGAGWDLVTYER